MPRADPVLLTLAILSVAALWSASALLSPPAVTLQESASRVGERVLVEARVVQASPARLLLADAGARMPAFPPKGASAAVGDLVRATGVVSDGVDGPVLNLDSLVVVELAAKSPLTPADLAAAPQAWSGARVAVLGTARGAMLEGGGARIAWAGPAPPADAATWIAVGTFRYQSSHAAYVLQVESWTRPS